MLRWLGVLVLLSVLGVLLWQLRAFLALPFVVLAAMAGWRGDALPDLLVPIVLVVVIVVLVAVGKLPRGYD